MTKHTTRERIPQLCACGCGNPVNVDASRNKQPKYFPYHHIKTTPITERFWKYVDKRGPDECWEWQGYKDDHGYGQVGSGGKFGTGVLTHRLSYEIANGPIPNGLNVLHKCDNPKCCNPAHLFLGTHADNVADMVKKGRHTLGEKSGTAKLTEDQVKEIRQHYKRGGIGAIKLGRQYGVSKSTIEAIIYRVNWKHLP